MKIKRLLVLGGALSVAFAATAQSTAPADPAFTPEAFRAHVAFLADDLLEGRKAGTRGYDLGARYVASQFEALGLEPANGEDWFQPVDFVRYRLRGVPSLTVGGKRLTHGEDFIARPSPESEPFEVEAPIVFVGYGLDLPSRGYDDYRGLDVAGKIVVLLSGTPIGTPSDVAAHLSSEKARMASDRGAVGMLVLRSPAEEESFPWSRAKGFADRPGTTWVAPSGKPHEAHGLRFSATLGPAAAAALFEDAPQSLDRLFLEASRPDGRPQGFVLGRRATFAREGAEISRFTSTNVVARLPGADPSVNDEHVLLMAHLDGLGIAEGRGHHDGAGESGEEDRIRNGAMDNATGVATLIEVARQMVESGNRPRRPVLFAAVTAEEMGLLGADYLARHPASDGEVVGVLNLDMPILTYDFRDVIAFGAEHSTLGPIVERAAAGMNVALTPDPLPEEGLFTRSDHYRFVQQGVPSVFLMTGFAGEGQERFTGFLGGAYHSPGDDLSLPFNWRAGARFAELNYRIARAIADSPEAPLWYSDSFFGAAVAAGQALAERGAHAPQAAAR